MHAWFSPSVVAGASLQFNHLLNFPSRCSLINLSLSNPVHRKYILALRIVSAPHFLIVSLHQVRKLSASGSPPKDPLKERITLDVRITVPLDEVRKPPSNLVASLTRCCWGKLGCLSAEYLVQGGILHVHTTFLIPAALNNIYRVGMDGYTLCTGRLIASLIVPP